MLKVICFWYIFGIIGVVLEFWVVILTISTTVRLGQISDILYITGSFSNWHYLLSMRDNTDWFTNFSAPLTWFGSLTCYQYWLYSWIIQTVDWQNKILIIWGMLLMEAHNTFHFISKNKFPTLDGLCLYINIEKIKFI